MQKYPSASKEREISQRPSPPARLSEVKPFTLSKRALAARKREKLLTDQRKARELALVIPPLVSEASTSTVASTPPVFDMRYMSEELTVLENVLNRYALLQEEAFPVLNSKK